MGVVVSQASGAWNRRAVWRSGLLVLFAVGFLHGLWWTNHKAERWYKGQDSEEYRLLAHNLLDGNGYSRERQPPYAPTLYREPGYPAFLAVVFAATGRSDQAVAIVQAALLGLSAVVAALLARGVFRRPSIALLGGLWTALSPDLGDHSRYEMSEALFAPAFLLAALVAFHAWRSGRASLHLAAGLAFGLAGYVRVMLVAGALVLQGLTFLAFGNRRRQLILSTLLMAALSLTLAPWVLRNVVDVQRVSFAGRSGAYLLPRGDKAAAPLDKQLRLLGLAAWVSTYPLGEPFVPVSRLHTPPYLWDGPLGEFAHLDAEKSFTRYCDRVQSAQPGESINVQDECNLTVGVDLILRHPVQYVYMTLVEFVRLNFYPYPSKLSLIHNWTVWLGIAAATVSVVRRRSRDEVWLILLVLSFILPSVAGDALDRYGVPLVPFYSLFAAAGVVRATDWARAWWARRRARELSSSLPRPGLS